MKVLFKKEIGAMRVYDLSVNHDDHSFALDNNAIVHNCAYVIADCEIEDVIPVIEVGGVKRVTGPEHKQCESMAGLQKYDFLVVSAIKDARICMDYINKKHNDIDMETGYFAHNGEKTYIWDLPDDKGTYDMLARGETETVFQLNTVTATPVVKKVQPTSIVDCATITSLVRPGPLGFTDEKTGRNMVEEYIERKFGRSRSDIEVLAQLLPETHGVIVFQEQVTFVARELAGMNVEDSENLRIAMGKKKIKLLESLKPVFISGASKKVDDDTAAKIWEMLLAFSGYGFNKCLSGNTVLLDGDGNAKSETISDLFSLKEYGFGISKDSVGNLIKNKIVDIRYEGVRKVFTITTEGGRIITGTDNHKFPTKDGELMLSELVIGDSLFVQNNKNKSEAIFEKILNIQESGYTDVYDVEMEAPFHNFVTDTGIVTCNSHAVAYSVISYACAFMKHNYPLEWWAAILTNATSKEINEVFYKYTKDMVLPPDINLSTEQIVIDYDQQKLRSKLSMITGLGTKVANKIMENRPYRNIKEFISKKPCGPSLTKKLIHVGVLDSLFDANFDLDQKMNEYEYNVNLVTYNKKLIEYDEKITKLSISGDEKGVVRVQKLKLRYVDKGVKVSTADPTYVALTKKKDFLLKKSVFPTINLDLQKVLESNTIAKVSGEGRFRMISNIQNKPTHIYTGEMLQAIDEMDVRKDIYFCTPSYVIDSSEFTYKNGARKALKLILDSSGYMSEKVLWPDYESGELKYDIELKKGAIIWVFYSKKVDKPYTNITQILIEENSIL